MAKTYAKHIPKIVMITGATGGFGQAFAKKFAAAGCTLILHGRNTEKLQTLCDSLDTQTYALVFDLLDKQGTIDAIQNIPSHFQKIDVLINNAGGAIGMDKAQDANLDDWDQMIDMNAASLARITRLILPQMVERQTGHIINIGSTAGTWPYPGGNVYGAVKAFIKQFSLNLRADLIGTNIRVSNIEPAIAETSFALNRFKGDQDKASAVYDGWTPLSAEDIAETIFWTATMPAHVNVNSIEIMPTQQSFNPLHIEKGNKNNG